MGIVFEGYAFYTAVTTSIDVKGRRTWWQFIRTSRIPELTVVLLEDLGALIGLVLAMSAITLATVTGDPVWDAIGTITIGLLLGAIAILLAVEMKGLLIGEAARPRIYQEIRDAMLQSPHVQNVIHLRTQHFGPEQLLVGAKLAFDPGLSLGELADAIDDVEQRVREVAPIARPMYIEPDLMRTTATPDPSDDHHD